MPSTEKIIDLSALSHFKSKLDLVLAGKADSSAIPTNVSELTNDSGYQNATQVNAAIQTAIAGISGVDFQIVASYQDLPATGTKGVIYLVPNSGTAPDIYDEYIWVTNTTTSTSAYEKIGTTAVDLSGYVQFTDIVYATNAEIDALFTSAS
jgi:hypothetical protein